MNDIKRSTSSARKLTKLEKKTQNVAKSIHYSRYLAKGKKLEFDDLIPLRPANKNISPKYYKKFIGKKLKKNKNKFSILRKRF